MVSMSKAKYDNRVLPKRFYTAVTTEERDGGWVILLDGKPVKTPAKLPLSVAREALARAIVAEWDAQQEFINADAMPLTRLVSIARDRVPLDRAALLEDMLRYAETDLLCYRAAFAEKLGQLQAQHFDPILAWVRDAHGITLQVTDGIMPIEQPQTSVQKIGTLFSQANDGELAALAMMVPLVGSSLLALALWKGEIAIDRLLIAARLDETEQAHKWGEDEEARAAWEAKAKDIAASAFFLTHSALN